MSKEFALACENSNKIFSYVSSKLLVNQNISLLTDNAGNSISNLTEICQVLVDAFSENCTHSSTSSQTCIASTVDGFEALNVVIDEVIAFKALSKVKSCAAGSENISRILLNKLAGRLTRLLTVLFQQPQFQKNVSLDWKVAKVLPVYKSKGDRY